MNQGFFQSNPQNSFYNSFQPIQYNNSFRDSQALKHHEQIAEQERMILEEEISNLLSQSLKEGIFPKECKRSNKGKPQEQYQSWKGEYVPQNNLNVSLYSSNNLSKNYSNYKRNPGKESSIFPQKRR